jgi:hypothetical protein
MHDWRCEEEASDDPPGFRAQGYQLPVAIHQALHFRPPSHLCAKLPIHKLLTYTSLLFEHTLL